MVRRKAVLERCAALRCLWHGYYCHESESIEPSAPQPEATLFITFLEGNARGFGRPRLRFGCKKRASADGTPPWVCGGATAEVD
eukprot:6169995-Prymnesium_polylepis.1